MNEMRQALEKKIMDATLERSPFPHLIVENFFPDETYNNILKYNPFINNRGEEWLNAAASYNVSSRTPYHARKQINFHADASFEASPESSAFWDELKECFLSDIWFEGLSEKFENAEIGSFAGPVPDLPGVVIVKGYFEDTCTEALRAEVGRVAFAHLDADLYGSTLVALRWLTPLLGNGSLILFDEFTGGEKAEARAFADWQAETGTTVVRIAEFDREPSGWGEIPDKRLLFQVIDKDRTSWAVQAEDAAQSRLPHRSGWTARRGSRVALAVSLARATVVVLRNEGPVAVLRKSRYWIARGGRSLTRLPGKAWRRH